MRAKTFQFDLKELKITVSQVEDVLGYNEGGDREFVTALIEEILEETKVIADIRAQYRIFNNISFEKTNRSVAIDNISFNIKNIVFGLMNKSDTIAVFLCTAGGEIGIRSRKAMMERDLLRGYIYDVVGSEIVEAAADLMQNDLEMSAGSEGKKITNRYSPGYCGWDVAEQHKLFDLMQENYCGIRLTPSALMDPVKSASGFIGIGENVKSNPYTCQMCDMNDCNYRKFREKVR
jgi:hypothetical protein